MDITEILDRWNSGEGKPYKQKLIDWEAYEADPDNVGCMCAQGQILHLEAGWSPERLKNTPQGAADAATAKVRNISLAHAVLLRNVNDSVDGAPSVVLTDPKKVLGAQWSKLLDFWWMSHNYTIAEWDSVVAARDAAWDAAWDAAGIAAWDEARAEAWAASQAAAWDEARDAASLAARNAARDAAGIAAWEIQGFGLLKERGKELFFLPMFGINSLDDIPPRPDDYGLGIVPKGGE